jgi:hypothetical protein
LKARQWRGPTVERWYVVGDKESGDGRITRFRWPLLVLATTFLVCACSYSNEYASTYKYVVNAAPETRVVHVRWTEGGDNDEWLTMPPSTEVSLGTGKGEQIRGGTVEAYTATCAPIGRTDFGEGTALMVVIEPSGEPTVWLDLGHPLPSATAASDFRELRTDPCG